MPALYAAAVIVFSDMYLTQPILPILSKEFGTAPATTGLSVSMVVLLIALASTAYGPLSDLWGRKVVIVTSCGLLSLPTLLCAVAPSFQSLLVFRALQGLFIPGLTAVAVAYLGDLVEPGKLGGAVGGWIAANVAGGLTGRVVSGILTDLFGWRSVPICYGVLTLLAAIFLAFALPVDQPSTVRDLRGAYRDMFAHLRNRRLVGGFLIGGSLFFGFLGIFTYLPYYLTSPPFSLSPALVAFAYISYLAGMIVSPIAGRLSSRIDRRWLIAAGLLIAMSGMALTLVPWLPLVVVSLFIICTGMFTAQAVAPAFVNTVAQQAKGGAGALYLMSYYLGGTMGGVIPGFAWQTFGWHGVVGTCVTALSIALLADWRLCEE